MGGGDALAVALGVAMDSGANGLSRRTLGAGAKKELPRERSEELAGGRMLSWPEGGAYDCCRRAWALMGSPGADVGLALVTGAGAMAVWPCLASKEELAGGRYWVRRRRELGGPAQKSFNFQI